MKPVLSIAVWIGLCTALHGCQAPKGVSPPNQAPLASRQTDVGRPAQASGLNCRPDFVSVFERVSPSTVGIAAGHRVDGRFRPIRMGTAFAWDNQGHLVTNAHIVAEADLIRVRRRDGKPFEAKIVGLDAATDLAVLRVVGLGLQPTPRGQDLQLRPGQWVAAIGHPFGMEYSIAVGVISAVGRFNVPGLKQHTAEFIQSDIAIFEGNSGGPLINTDGQVIGLNTAKKGEGLSFSTHIAAVDTVVNRLLEHGRFERGFAGLYPQAVSFKDAENADLTEPRGAMVRATVGDGPADKAGLLPGDIILELNGQPIKHHRSVAWLIAATPPGKTVTLLVAREYDRMMVSVTLGRAP
ncbi:MAG: S1C family serine protease [Bradymonadia bacterium]